LNQPISSLTGTGSYFEDFEVGAKMRHARGSTVEQVESQLLTKLVMNSADAHYNEQKMQALPFGKRLVFGLITGSIVIGLTTQDTAENALAELRLDRLKFRAPVFLGDTLTAYTEVLETRDADRDDAGIVRFKHWGLNQDDRIVFEGEREVLIKRRSHWAKESQADE
jgi:acyl dehydratase